MVHHAKRRRGASNRGGRGVDRDGRRSDRGFTLIELMVVVLIIGILLSIAIPTFLGARLRAQDGVAKESLRTAVTAATVASAEDMSFSSIDASTMAAEEGALSYVEAGTPSTGPKVISIGGFDDVLAAAVLSDSGACWLATSDVRGGSNYVSSDGAKECTAKLALARR